MFESEANRDRLMSSTLIILYILIMLSQPNWIRQLSAKQSYAGSSPVESLKLVGYMKKMSKKDATDNDPIVITDDNTISALQTEVNYWKTRYELLLKYGDTTIKYMQVSG